SGEAPCHRKIFFAKMGETAWPNAVSNPNRTNRRRSDSRSRMFGSAPRPLTCARASPPNGFRRHQVMAFARSRDALASNGMRRMRHNVGKRTYRSHAVGQRPSLALRISFTAWGLALPPDDFITWPTNQPIAFGFVFASAT